jgi:preprotein translocase subunit SecB
MTADEDRGRQLASRVGAGLELLDLRLRRVDAELHQPASDGPFQFTLDVKPSVSQVDDLVAYDLTYEFASMDDEGELVFDGTIELSVLYQISGGNTFSDDELAAFGRLSVLFIAYPYLRELLHSLTGRMGLPPLILDVMRAPADEEDAEPST